MTLSFTICKFIFVPADAHDACKERHLIYPLKKEELVL